MTYALKSVICAASGLVGMAIALTLAPLPGRSQTQPENSFQEIPQVVSQRDDVQSGRAVVSGTEGQFVGQVLVNTSPETAWEVLIDYDNFSRFLPGVASSRLLVREDNQTVFEQVNEIRVAFFSRRTRVRIATVETFPTEIAFQAIEGDVETLQGSWQIDPVGEGQVIITHRVTVDPGPDNRGLFFNIYRNNLRDTLTALKREMERRTERGS